MPSALTLPRLAWGASDAPRRALLVHGLGSSGALMWRFGTALADAGWRAEAVDLRGHGSAPRALEYSVAAYAADLAGTRPADFAHTHPAATAPWDLVIGHSLGGAASVIASADHPDWTRRLVLVDPGIVVMQRDADIVRSSQERAFDDNRIAVVRDEHPHWHPHDLELKVDAVARASRWAVEQTSVQNQPWDVRDAAARVAVPTHVLGADPAVYSLFTGEVADGVLAANPLFTMSIVPGAGHSPHRDEPEATLAQLFDVLGG
ncbi:MAG TPA: alpha/beta hydrolase [Microbacterium sp.]|uniref:alpha/beta fold hydrolase n=1 Tax=Microbacterium sp. TaxID=51671 RepID=UPI002CEE784B|nr:alpha/beta hydrolase [Microbacterium sp.]HWI30625.1 alpha/beta hydrolase [Microbacterium sp.]